MDESKRVSDELLEDYVIFGAESARLYRKWKKDVGERTRLRPLLRYESLVLGTRGPQPGQNGLAAAPPLPVVEIEDDEDDEDDVSDDSDGFDYPVPFRALGPR